MNKAATYKQKGENEKAIDEYSKVISEGVNYDYIMALIERGYNYRQLQLNALALPSFEKAFTLDPHNIQCLCNLAICYYNEFQFRKTYEICLHGLYEAELQNDHHFDDDFMAFFKKACDVASQNGMKVPITSDGVQDYIAEKIKQHNVVNP